jgi:hypothetical protein
MEPQQNAELWFQFVDKQGRRFKDAVPDVVSLPLSTLTVKNLRRALCSQFAALLDGAHDIQLQVHSNRNSFLEALNRRRQRLAADPLSSEENIEELGLNSNVSLEGFGKTHIDPIWVVAPSGPNLQDPVAERGKSIISEKIRKSIVEAHINISCSELVSEEMERNPKSNLDRPAARQ